MATANFEIVDMHWAHGAGFELYLKPSTNLTPMRLFQTSTFKGLLATHLVFASSIAAALFLRIGRGNWLREEATRLLGYESRAVVEHLLAAIGIPLVAGVANFCFILAACWASYRICKLMGWTWKPLAKHYSKVVVFQDLSLYVACYSTAYVLIGGWWEWSQAYSGVYGHDLRGYVQWGQFSADICGALIACFIARAVSLPRH